MHLQLPSNDIKKLVSQLTSFHSAKGSEFFCKVSLTCLNVDLPLVSSAVSFYALLRLSFAFGVITLSAEGVFAWTHVFDHRLGNLVRLDSELILR